MNDEVNGFANNPVRWGILGVSAFAMNKLLPAMRLSRGCELAAIASRDFERACDAASALGIPTAYGIPTGIPAYQPTAVTKTSSPILPSMPSTFRCPTTCTRPMPSKRSRPANTSFARSRPG